MDQSINLSTSLDHAHLLRVLNRHGAAHGGLASSPLPTVALAPRRNIMLLVLASLPVLLLDDLARSAQAQTLTGRGSRLRRRERRRCGPTNGVAASVSMMRDDRVREHPCLHACTHAHEMHTSARIIAPGMHACTSQNQRSHSSRCQTSVIYKRYMIYVNKR